MDMRSMNRRRLVCLGIMLVLIPLGLLCRFVPMGLPAAIVKYGGSFLWAAMVYWLIAFLFARQPPMVLGLIALLVSTAVEFFKDIHTPALETFRGTIAGKVLLGRYFSYADIAVYWIAIACSVWVDRTRARHTHAPRE
jgi:hypothetical protein